MCRWCGLMLLSGLLLAQSPEGGEGEGRSIPPELQPAWEKYEELLKKHPGKPLLNYNFGNLAYSAGDYKNALDAYRLALRSQDKEAQAKILYNLGNTLFRAAQPGESKAFYRKALELDPDDADARVNYELALQMEQQQSKGPSPQNPGKDPNAEEQQRSSSSESDQSDSDEQEKSEQSESQADNSASEQNAGDRQSDGQPQEDQPESGDQQSQQRSRDEEDLQREEVEAILNALRANEEKLMKRTYRPPSSITFEKDW